MNEKYYALFSCSIFKTRSTFELLGVFTPDKLKEVIKRKAEKDFFHLKCDISKLAELPPTGLNSVLKNGHVQEIVIDEFVK
jgi:hypothetical protein